MDNNLKKIKVFVVILFLSSICFLSSVLCSITYAAVPHLINYQGRLTDASGAPLKNDSCNITFSIYDAETTGTLLWQGTYNSVPLAKGTFNILLGSINDTGYNFQNLAFDKPYWLEIKVGTDEPMKPRQRITSAGYAITAERLVDDPLPTARGGTGATSNANTANGVVVPTGAVNAANGAVVLDANSKITVAQLGVWVDKSSSYSAQQATTDGFVLVYAQNAILYIYTDSNANPTTLRATQQADAGGLIAVMCPIRKGDYWKVTYVTSAPTAVYWIPLGA
ncbi:MAG: hypothetical protein Q7K98_05565 [Candidatus Omnitrophota bacterium]|nr:hypothetical protein [Candidatus Omnitrophota bacterium]